MTTYADVHPRPRSIHIEATSLNESILGLVFCLGIHFIAYYLEYYIVCIVTLLGIYYSVYQLYLVGNTENVYEEVSEDEESAGEDDEYDDMPALETLSREDRVNEQLQQVVEETRARNSKRAYEAAVVSAASNVDMATQIKSALKQLQDLLDSARRAAEVERRLYPDSSEEDSVNDFIANQYDGAYTKVD